jgi:ABC-2 type transport system permease protein
VAISQQALATQAVIDRLGDAGLSDEQVAQVLDGPRVEEVRVDTQSESRRGTAAVIAIVLYLLLLMLTIQVANGVAIEKANRISEVLLAIVRPSALLFGKVVGVGLVGFLTLLVGATPVLVKQAVGGSLPAGLPTAIAAGSAWFVLGLALYLTIAGSLGALVERQEEAGAAVAPLTFILIGSYLVGQSAADTTLGAVLAVFPLSSPLVMPSRIAIGAATPGEIAASLVVGLLTVGLVVRFGSTIYRRAIVRTGRRLSVREALRPA